MASKKRRPNGGVEDLTIRILKSIRDEIRSTNEGLETLRTDLTGRLDQTNARLDQTNARLDQHEKVLVKLIGEVQSLNGRFDNFLTGAHKQEHDELRARIGRIEDRLGKAG
ncbi:MAG: hypothetical protein KF819_25115 [Labilithrix sp.]|nr:hypothetical protein [Labilithrix sp.]